MAIFMGKIAAIRSRIICVSNNDNHEPQMHLWIICELQILIINGGPEIPSIIGSFQLWALSFKLLCLHLSAFSYVTPFFPWQIKKIGIA